MDVRPTRRVVVVDDDPDIVDILAFNLSAAGYEVVSATDGDEAIDVIVATRPDVVLLDVMMPTVGGLEVLSVLKGDPNTATIPVVMLTARSSDADVEEGWDAGADFYLTKPFDLGELLLFLDRLSRSAPAI